MKLIEQYLQEIRGKNRLFHISLSELPNILKPRTPNNLYTKMGYEDKTINRISVGPDIDHCLLGMGKNTVKETETFYVYEPVDYSKLKIMPNKEIVKRNLVPDAKQTKEIWLLSPTEFKEIAKIKAIKMRHKYVTIPNFQNEPRRYRRVHYWKWELIEGKI